MNYLASLLLLLQQKMPQSVDNSGSQLFSHSILGLVVGSCFLLVLESNDWLDIVGKYAYESS